MQRKEETFKLLKSNFEKLNKGYTQQEAFQAENLAKMEEERA